MDKPPLTRLPSNSANRKNILMKITRRKTYDNKTGNSLERHSEEFSAAKHELKQENDSDSIDS